MMAVERLKRAYEEVKDVSEKLQPKLQHCGTQFQNFATGYLVLGRLFFSSISSQKSSLKCHDWWLILALTLLSAFVYFLLFMDTFILLYQIHLQMDMILQKLAEIGQQYLILEPPQDQVVVLSMEAGEQCSDHGCGFEFGFYEKMLMFDHFRIVGMKVYLHIIACALLAVTAIELSVFNHLLCNYVGD